MRETRLPSLFSSPKQETVSQFFKISDDLNNDEEPIPEEDFEDASIEF